MRSTAKAAPTVYPRAQRILERHVDQVVKGLKLIVTKRKLTGSKAKTLPDAAAYYQRNRACMRYDTHLGGAAEAGSRTARRCCSAIGERQRRRGVRRVAGDRRRLDRSSIPTIP